MQNKTFYFIILALIILLIGAVLFYYFTIRPNELSQEQMGKIIREKDLGACDKISSKEQAVICRDAIASTLAKENLDETFCGELLNEEDQIACQKALLYEEAEKEGVAVCQQAKTDEEKTECQKEYYFTMAIQKNDASQCVNLVQKDAIKECQNDFDFWQKTWPKTQ
jgi:hypothetical protein